MSMHEPIDSIDNAVLRAEIERLGNNLIAQEQITLLRNKDLLKAQAEVERLRADSRMMICLWCGEAHDARVSPVEAKDDPSRLAPAYEWATAHDQACPKNPLRERAERAETRLAGLESEASHAAALYRAEAEHRKELAARLAKVVEALKLNLPVIQMYGMLSAVEVAEAALAAVQPEEGSR